MSPSPVAPNLFITEPELRLIGGRHHLTRKIVFPLPVNEDYEPLELPRRGLLWSYTIQRFAPKSPPYRRAAPHPGVAGFEPFAVGYVELPGALIVESRLTDIPFERLRVGLAMELTTVEVGGADGSEVVLTYAFRPSSAPDGAPGGAS